jgi:hypothetical protein
MAGMSSGVGALTEAAGKDIAPRRAISVVIPVYNAEHYVREAVRSAVAQPEVVEVLLVEDGSPDGSLGVCEQLTDELDAVRLLRHPGGANRGAAASRNLGIGASSAGLVAFLDADDFYLPGRFNAAAAMLEAWADIDGVYEAVGTYFQDEAARERWRRDGRRVLTTVRARVPPEELLRAFRQPDLGRFCTDGIVVRKTLFERTGLFDEGLDMSEDTVMWMKMAAVGRLAPGSIDAPVAMRRVHSGNRANRTAMVMGSRRAADALYRWASEQRLGSNKLALCLDARLESECRIINLRASSHALRLLLKTRAAIALLASSPWRQGARLLALRIGRFARR